ncbi:hypothetical protein GWI33_004603 [Rhynchophorus ferrugineus]|uniref:Uncharacterized protein n=1 Tax=Rhynchophorus ferrugineus TaxID=354439 RepID=A0A834IT21_RHYFE|nr:hypothetical protein GWI33_004603 [Rhynchophorus ferrugineus]
MSPATIFPKRNHCRWRFQFFIPPDRNTAKKNNLPTTERNEEEKSCFAPPPSSLPPTPTVSPIPTPLTVRCGKVEDRSPSMPFGQRQPTPKFESGTIEKPPLEDRSEGSSRSHAGNYTEDIPLGMR